MCGEEDLISFNSLLILLSLYEAFKYLFKMLVSLYEKRRGNKFTFSHPKQLNTLYSAGMLNAAFSSFLFEFYDRKWIWTKSL